MKKNMLLRLSFTGIFMGYMLLFSYTLQAQQSSVVQIHADKGSGYGVAYGGPQNLPDRIVTALHVVAGKSNILVVYQGKQSYATIEKVYKASDLALLKLQTPLGIPQMSLYSGNPPWNTNVQFWEIPVNTRQLMAKTTVLEESTSLAKISPRVANNGEGLNKALCSDAGQFYPGMSTEVINFKEPNIRKAHSGSPLTFRGQLIGLVDGGANLVGGKSCVWAIPSESILKLYTQGTAYNNMQSCGGTSGNQFMYSGMRSDNPLLSQEEQYQASNFENSNISNPSGLQLEIYHDYRMDFEELYNSMFPEDQEYIDDIFDSEDDYTLDNLLRSSVDIYTEGSTGVTLMVPSNTQLTANRNEFGTYLVTHSPGGSISIHFYITSGGTMEGGMEKLKIFKNTFINKYGYDLYPDPEDIEDYSDDEYNPYYSEYVSKLKYDENDNVIGDYTAELMVNDGDFLAILIEVHDWEKYENNPDEIHYLYLMESCALFSDFGYY